MRPATTSSSSSRGSAWADRSSSPAPLPATPSSRRHSYGTTNACSTASTCASASTWRSRRMPTPSSWHRRPAVRPRSSRLRGILDRVGRSARQPPRRETGRGRRLGRGRLGARRGRAPGGERVPGRARRRIGSLRRDPARLPAQPLCRAPLPGWNRGLASPRARCVGRRPRQLHEHLRPRARGGNGGRRTRARPRARARARLEVQGALEAGDRLSPRSLEEAILEGSLAGRGLE